YRDRIENRLRHLRGNRALPDQRVEPVKVPVDLALDVARRDGSRRRTDRLVRLLRILRLRLVDARLLGHLLVAVQPAGHLANLADGFCRKRYGVGTHVGDEADVALTQIEALVELLREAHRSPGVVAQLARGFLLESGRGEGRGRCTPPLLAVDCDDAQLTEPVRRGARLSGGLPGRLADGALDLSRLRLVRKRELLDFPAGVFGELQREGSRLACALPFERPILLRDEGGDLFLALADHAQRGTLHAACREAAAHFLPKKR